MLTLLTQYSTILLLIGVAVVLLALRNTIRNYNQSRNAPYYILREEAFARAGRWTIISFVSIAITVAIAIFGSQAQPELIVVPTSTASATAANNTSTPVPTDTSTAIATATATAQPSATPTAGATATATVAADVPQVLLTPIPDSVPPAAQARFEFLTLASQIDPDTLNPIDRGSQFPTGSNRVYVFFRASGVNDGATWGIFCRNNGEIVDLFVGLWEDGPAVQTSRAFCALEGSEGAYSVQAYLGTQLAFEVDFTLSGAPPTETPLPPTATPAPSATPES